MTEQFWNLHDHEYVFVEEGTMFEEEVGDIVLCVHCHEPINRRQTPSMRPSSSRPIRYSSSP